MADPYQPIQPNSPLQISARTFNGLLKAGQDYSRRKFGDLASGVEASKLIPSCKVWIYNPGNELPEFSIVGLGEMPAPPTSRPLDAVDDPIFQAAAPSGSEPFAILSGGLPSGAIGEAVVVGIAVVQINVADSSDSFAAPQEGVYASLISGSAGVPILWKESGTGLKWAVVLMNGGGFANSITLTVVTDVSFDTGTCTLSVTKSTFEITGSNLSIKAL